MTAEIIPLGINTTVSHDPDRVLEAAKGQQISDVLVVGLREGKAPWFSGSTSDVERIVFMLEWAKRFIMDQVRADDEGR